MAATAGGMEKVWSGIIDRVPVGIYISVPFCRTKCSYCNFASDVFSKPLFGRYLDRVCEDIENAERIAAEMGGLIEHEVDSIYLGGGTPTVLEAAQLERIFSAVRSQFDVCREAEVTVECAPGTLTPTILTSLLRCGVNRVSLGVQSFVDQEAAAVGRLHNRDTVLEDISCLRKAGITNINLDLIAGLPHQTHESWDLSLRTALASGVPHVSVYMLEVDEDSRLGRELLAGGKRYHAHFVPNEDLTADFYSTACERLEDAGIAQYEISNFARKGMESRHNLKYWTRQPYLGFGVDAHSMLRAMPEGCNSTDELEAVRISTADNLELYISSATSQRTIVTRRAALEENFFLGLRLVCGVNLTELSSTFGAEAVEPFGSAIRESIDDGLLLQAGELICLTPRGRLLSNEVFQRFLSQSILANAASNVPVNR